LTTQDSARSYERITDDDLRRLDRVAAHEVSTFFERNPTRAAWRQQQRFVALEQGGADHYIRGERGVWDLDLVVFFAQHPDDRDRPYLRRAPRRWDWGPSKFGHAPLDVDYTGRAVDVMLWVIPDRVEPLDGLMEWLTRRHRVNASRPDLAHEPVVLIRPDRGRVVWDPPHVPPPLDKTGGHPPPAALVPA
jgi:hypothetical protein